MMAAKGRLPDKAPQLTLDGANMRHATISASVEMTTVTKLLACGIGNMCRSCGKIIVWLTVWFIPDLHSRKNFGRTEHIEGISKGSHRVLIGGKAHVPALGHIVEVLNDPSQVSIAMPP